MEKRLPGRSASVDASGLVWAGVLVTPWSRVGWWEPTVVLPQGSAVFAGTGLGAALDDVLPGS